MMKPTLAAIVLAASASASGCASIFANHTPVIPVATNPPGAVVYVNGVPAGQTPTVVQLDSRQPANIQIYLPGFQPVQMWRQKSISGWFWVNILFWPGFLVDLATGKYDRYDNNGIAVGLTPMAGPPPDWYQQPQPGYQQQPYPEQQPYPQQPPPPPGPAPVQPGAQIPQVPLNPQVPPPQPQP